ncbi:MAG: hypothetical protein LCH53_12960 [Bacteroidetes bacterium]|nr:hypothetical protein [Bacteroidota bacterium]
MRLIFFIVALCVVTGCQKNGTPPSTASNDAERRDSVFVGRTRLETFSAKTGSVILRGFSDAGTLRAQFGTTLDVQAQEMTDASSGERVSGVIVRIKDDNPYSSASASYVDADELTALVEGLDYVSRVNASSTKLEDFQADYRTRGDLTVSVYSSNRGRVEAAVKSGTIGRSTAFISIDQLTQFRNLIVQSKALLDSAAAEPDSALAMRDSATTR